MPAESAGDEATKAVINDIIACLGADTDASGKPGVSQAKVDQFFADAAGLLRLVEEGGGQRRAAAARPNTEAAAAAVKAVKAKVEDYFARCRLAAFDPRASQRLESRGEGIPRPRRQRA